MPAKLRTMKAATAKKKKNLESGGQVDQANEAESSKENVVVVHEIKAEPAVVVKDKPKRQTAKSTSVASLVKTEEPPPVSSVDLKETRKKMTKSRSKLLAASVNGTIEPLPLDIESASVSTTTIETVEANGKQTKRSVVSKSSALTTGATMRNKMASGSVGGSSGSCSESGSSSSTSSASTEAKEAKKTKKQKLKSLDTSFSDSFTKFFVNKKITDYFQVRKSTRKCKSDLEKEKRQQIEDAILNGREEGLEVRHVEQKGRGIFATRSFKRGDFVCEYAGEMIGYAEAKEREERYAKDESVGCYMYFFMHKSKSYCIDATAESQRLGRLLNHSKLEGNCQTKLFEIGAQPYLILVAARDIDCGEELTYDYGDRNKMAIESHPWLAQ